jgi:hypothetical protein
MIAYEELEHALARWKMRRSGGGGEVTEITSFITVESAKAEAIEDDTRTPLPPDRTGEIDLADAVVEDAQ